MHKLVLIRHGQSQWNLDNRFSGWADVDLTAQGMAEAQEAGRLPPERPTPRTREGASPVRRSSREKLPSCDSA